MTEEIAALPRLRSRSAYFDYLDGHSVRVGGDELVERRLSGPVPKTYMLETVRNGQPGPDPAHLFRHDAVALEEVDSDGLFAVHDRRYGQDVGLVEWLNDRHPVFYTLLRSHRSDAWVHEVVDRDPWLDRLWLSAPAFERLWQYVEATAPGHRFTTLKFDHDAFYEVFEGIRALNDDSEVEGRSDGDEEDFSVTTPVERRKSVFSLSDRVATVRAKLDQLQDLYSPLESLVQLRIPAEGRGGHDFYHDGKITNRSDSFLDHRGHARFVVDLYRQSTDFTEETLWMAAEEAGDAGGWRMRGAPLTLQFSEALTEATFERFVTNVFNRRNNRFRLTGRVDKLGPTKVQVSAIDRHLWQPLLMEVTSRQMLAVLPNGTCGNTVHRLVTNIQRWLDPAVKAWVGPNTYDAVVGTDLQVAS